MRQARSKKAKIGKDKGIIRDFFRIFFTKRKKKQKSLKGKIVECVVRDVVFPNIIKVKASRKCQKGDLVMLDKNGCVKPFKFGRIPKRLTRWQEFWKKVKR